MFTKFFSTDTKPNAFFRRIDWTAFWGATCAAFLVYFFTLGPSVGLEDSGELATAAAHLGVPHPPGYPFWSLCSWIFCRLFSWVTYMGQPTPAWAVSLFSAVAGAFAAGCTAMLICRSGSDMLDSMGALREDDSTPVAVRQRKNALMAFAGGIGGSLAFAFSPVEWSQSTIVEIYSLNALFLMAVFLLSYRWMRSPSDRILWLIAFIFGLGLTNYQVLLLAALPLAIIIALRDISLFRDFVLILIPMGLTASLLKVGSMLRAGRNMTSEVINKFEPLVYNPFSPDLSKHFNQVETPNEFLLWTGCILLILAPFAAFLAKRFKPHSARIGSTTVLGVGGAGALLLFLASTLATSAQCWTGPIESAVAPLVQPCSYAFLGFLLAVCVTLSFGAIFMMREMPAEDQKKVFWMFMAGVAFFALVAFLYAYNISGYELTDRYLVKTARFAGPNGFAGQVFSWKEPTYLLSLGLALLVALAATTPRGLAYALPVATVQIVAFLLLKKGALNGLTHPQSWWFFWPIIWNFVVLALAFVTLPNGRAIATATFWAEIGVSFYAYMPIVSDLRNPPMNWGYPRTWEGFKHAIMRGQYEAIGMPDFFSANGFARFLEQLGFYFQDLRMQFTLVAAALALVPFALWKATLKLRDRVRPLTVNATWIAGVLYVIVAVLVIVFSELFDGEVPLRLDKLLLGALALLAVVGVYLAISRIVANIWKRFVDPVHAWRAVFVGVFALLTVGSIAGLVLKTGRFFSLRAVLEKSSYYASTVALGITPPAALETGTVICLLLLGALAILALCGGVLLGWSRQDEVRVFGLTLRPAYAWHYFNVAFFACVTVGLLALAFRGLGGAFGLMGCLLACGVSAGAAFLSWRRLRLNADAAGEADGWCHFVLGVLALMISVVFAALLATVCKYLAPDGLSAFRVEATGSKASLSSLLVIALILLCVLVVLAARVLAVLRRMNVFAYELPQVTFHADDVSQQWLISVGACFGIMSLFLVALANVKGDIQDGFIQKVKFISSHGMFSLWIGYGIAVGLALAYSLINRLLGSRRALAGALFAVCCVIGASVALIPIYENYTNDRLVFAMGSAEQNAHTFGWQFGNYQLRGANAIREELTEDDEPLPNPMWPAEMGPSALFFGGTDPGRFVPTYMIYSADVRPDVFLITQNALADDTCMSVERDLYGDQIWIPSKQDSAQSFNIYVDEVKSGKRNANADLRIENGRVQVTGALGVMEINGILTKMMFDHERLRRDFFVEESYVIQWMYPYLTPHGLIMKINPETKALTPDIVRNDMEFWDWYNRRLLRDPAFRRDFPAQKSFSKLRAAIAGLYAHEGRTKEAEIAFREAVLLYPASPEASFRYIQEVLMRSQRYDAALDILDYTFRVDPNTSRTAQMRFQILAFRAQQLFHAGKADEARATLRSLLASGDTNDKFDILISLAQTCLQCQDLEDAQKAVAQALVKMPPDIAPEQARRIAGILGFCGLHEEADKLLESVLREYSQTLQAHAGKDARAELYRKHAEAHLEYALAKYELFRFRVEQDQRAQKQKPAQPPVLDPVSYASILDALRKAFGYDSAETVHRLATDKQLAELAKPLFAEFRQKLLEKDVTDFPALLDAGRLFIDCGIKDDNARAVVLKAYNLLVRLPGKDRNRNHRNRVEMASLLTAVGLSNEAYSVVKDYIGELQQKVAAKPKDTGLHFEMAILLDAINQPDGVRDALYRAYQASPEEFAQRLRTDANMQRIAKPFLKQ